MSHGHVFAKFFLATYLEHICSTGTSLSTHMFYNELEVHSWLEWFPTRAPEISMASNDMILEETPVKRRLATPGCWQLLNRSLFER